MVLLAPAATDGSLPGLIPLPSGTPQPCEGSQVLASSSVNEVTLQAPSSCEAKVRLGPPKCPSSVKRIGSRLTREKGERLSSQLAVAGLKASLNVTRSVWLPASMKTLPVFQLTPMDGSPAPCCPEVVDPSAGWMQFGGGCDVEQSSGAG